MTTRSDVDTTTRRYIRHPSGMPIHFKVSGDVAPMRERVQNVSQGGLCFRAHIPLEPGDCLNVSIPVIDSQFSAEAVVIWCHAKGAEFEIGVRFINADDAYALRMVEQLCYIEEYRRKVQREQGRRLSSEQAALEWIAMYAADFPALS